MTIDEPLLKAIDRVARESKRTRSDVCRLALGKWLQLEREALLVREEQEAYRLRPVRPDEFGDLMAAQAIHEPSYSDPRRGGRPGRTCSSRRTRSDRS
jgi:metal-responsive CopG/Arc/MetJ family transcriptional regulator